MLEQRLAAKLDEDLQDSPVLGRPLPRRLRNFSLYADRYAISLAGPPAYSRRLREIEDETAGHEEALRIAWKELFERYAHEPQELARRWRELAKRWNFSAVNELIEGHNRWYPVEARLPMDPRTRDFVLVGGKPFRRGRLDADWILERFPADARRGRAAA